MQPKSRYGSTRARSGTTARRSGGGVREPGPRRPLRPRHSKPGGKGTTSGKPRPGRGGRRASGSDGTKRRRGARPPGGRDDRRTGKWEGIGRSAGQRPAEREPLRRRAQRSVQSFPLAGLRLPSKSRGSRSRATARPARSKRPARSAPPSPRENAQPPASRSPSANRQPPKRGTFATGDPMRSPGAIRAGPRCRPSCGTTQGPDDRGSHSPREAGADPRERIQASRETASMRPDGEEPRRGRAERVGWARSGAEVSVEPAPARRDGYHRALRRGRGALARTNRTSPRLAVPGERRRLQPRSPTGEGRPSRSWRFAQPSTRADPQKKPVRRRSDPGDRRCDEQEIPTIGAFSARALLVRGSGAGAPRICGGSWTAPSRSCSADERVGGS